MPESRWKGSWRVIEVLVAVLLLTSCDSSNEPPQTLSEAEEAELMAVVVESFCAGEANCPSQIYVGTRHLTPGGGFADLLSEGTRQRLGDLDFEVRFADQFDVQYDSEGRLPGDTVMISVGRPRRLASDLLGIDVSWLAGRHSSFGTTYVLQWRRDGWRLVDPQEVGVTVTTYVP